jgi:ankyrin repeat protein
LTKLLSDRVLVDLNAPLDDETKETLLHAACRHGQADFARLLLTWGASYASRDAAHAAPIHNAIAAGHGAVTRILAQYNTDYDAKAHVLAWGLRRHARRCRRKKMAIDAVAEAAKRDDLWPEAMTSTRSGRLARVSTEHSSAEAP